MEAPDEEDGDDNVNDGEMLEPLVSLEEGAENHAKKANKHPLNNR
jgi:hypothetical protein